MTTMQAAQSQTARHKAQRGANLTTRLRGSSASSARKYRAGAQPRVGIHRPFRAGPGGTPGAGRGWMRQGSLDLLRAPCNFWQAKRHELVRSNADDAVHGMINDGKSTPTESPTSIDSTLASNGAWRITIPLRKDISQPNGHPMFIPLEADAMAFADLEIGSNHLSHRLQKRRICIGFDYQRPRSGSSPAHIDASRFSELNEKLLELLGIFNLNNSPGEGFSCQPLASKGKIRIIRECEVDSCRIHLSVLVSPRRDGWHGSNIGNSCLYVNHLLSGSHGRAT